MTSPPRNCRFSMVELVILIVVFAVLVALLIPYSFRAREVAKTASCADNLRQCTGGLLLYASGNDNTICTYGNRYSGWYSQEGVPRSIGFSISPAGRSPITERPVTLCPDIWINAPSRNVNQAYGAAWFLPRPDYAGLECELPVKFPTNMGQIVMINNLPRPADYVLLADSAYTSGEGADVIPGIQCILFARQKAGATRHFPRAIALRHHGEANVSYADGHFGDTSDREAMMRRSKIGAYVDATGKNPIQYRP